MYNKNITCRLYWMYVPVNLDPCSFNHHIEENRFFLQKNRLFRWLDYPPQGYELMVVIHIEHGTVSTSQ
jgi:hypothetical protein